MAEFSREGISVGLPKPVPQFCSSWDVRFGAVEAGGEGGEGGKREI